MLFRKWNLKEHGNGLYKIKYRPSIQFQKIWPAIYRRQTLCMYRMPLSLPSFVAIVRL